MFKKSDNLKGVQDDLPEKSLDDSAADVIASLSRYQNIWEKKSPGNGQPITALLEQFSKLNQTTHDADEDERNVAEQKKNVFQVSNKYVQAARDNGEPDFLYHLGLVVSVDQTKQLFHDIKYVCVGGTPSRMHEFAVVCLEALNIQVPAGLGVTDLCGGHARYVMYKAGPVLTVSHGMGNPSISIMLHEVFKLLHYAQAGKDVKFIRIGTSGGVGVPGGTTIISDLIYNGIHENHYDQFILGKLVRRPAILDGKLCQDIMYHGTKPGLNLPVVLGNTLCADDFYEEQARIDGAFCEFTNEERVGFLEKCFHQYGIRNFEMESLAFAAMTRHAGFKAAVVCVALVNRLESDKISQKASDLEEWARRPQRIVVELIRSELNISPDVRTVMPHTTRQTLSGTASHLYPSRISIHTDLEDTALAAGPSVTKTADVAPSATSTVGVLPPVTQRPVDPSAVVTLVP